MGERVPSKSVRMALAAGSAKSDGQGAQPVAEVIGVAALRRSARAVVSHGAVAPRQPGVGPVGVGGANRARSGPAMTTTLAPAVLGTGAAAPAGWTALLGNPSALSSVVAELGATDTAYTRVAVTLVVAFVGVRVENPRDRRYVLVPAARAVMLVPLATST